MEENRIRALGSMTYGIYVLTSAHEDKINGMIASWVAQVSYDPLLLAVAVRPNRYSHQIITQSDKFALHSIAADQKDFMQRFKGPDPEAKFAGLEWSRGQTGCPLLADCLAVFECEVKAQYAPGDHTIFVGQVVEMQSANDGRAMCTMDYDRIYLGKS